MVEASYYEKLPNLGVRCGLCPHRCHIGGGEVGRCRVRENRGGVLVATNYGRCAALALDPVEKKPLYHFCPGKTVLSLGSQGCNLSCSFCQNWELVHTNVPTAELSPAQAVAMALDAGPSCVGIAYTYSEPLMWYEYVLETSQLARAQGLQTVLVTNGYILPEPLEELLPHITALNIDLKALEPQFYRRHCDGQVNPVKETIARAVGADCHVEVTTLLVTGENDSIDQVTQVAAWLKTIDPQIPLHLSRYFPRYQMERPPTPENTMEEAWQAAKAHLHHVYLGNVVPGPASDTYCYRCNKVVIRRKGYTATASGLEQENCRWCGSSLCIRL